MIVPGRDAEHWRQWGFLRRPVPETTTPAIQTPPANPTATNQATSPNTPQNDTSTNTNLQANPAQWNINRTQQLGITPNTQRHQTQADMQTPTIEHGEAQDNPPTPPQPNLNPIQPPDNYLSPWGDHFQQPKPPNLLNMLPELQQLANLSKSSKKQ